MNQSTIIPTKVIIDTDPGHDDAMALLLACKSSQLEVCAVTTVCGNSTIENTTRNARYILQTINKSGIPVYSGADKPLARDLVQAVVHGESGLAGVDPQNEPQLTNDAPEQIIRIVSESPGDITLITLGPLTNIAHAIQKDPVAMRGVKQIVSMGGAISVPGNKNRVAEFNIFVDPEAAQIVFDLPVPKVLIPLDACNRIRMQFADIGQIKNNSIRDLMSRMLKPYIDNIKADTGLSGALMYDPLTVFYVLQPDACKLRKYNIQIESEGALTRGMTVADKRRVTDGLAANIEVVTRIDGKQFMDAFISALSS